MEMKEHKDQGNVSAVFDNGRRGNPRMGCDCVQCFGYCMIDPDAMLRDDKRSLRIRNTTPVDIIFGASTMAPTRDMG
jgi:hypothetical protein